MKLSNFYLCMFLISFCGAGGIRFLESGAEAPVYKVAAIPGIQNPANKSVNLSGPAHLDHFAEEVIDQADPEFDMISGGDDCINLTEAEAPYHEGFQRNAMGRAIWSDAEKKENADAEASVLFNVRLQFSHADTDGDGCLNRTEFKADAEMEGPPPGFQALKIMNMGIENFTKEMEAEDKLEFDAMDRNADGKISKSEAYHFANANMPQADIDEQMLKKIFQESDTNGDNFLDFDEFLRAGQIFQGDGNETIKARPMWKPSLLATFRQQVLLGTIKTKRMHHRTWQKNIH